ncbi:hypothetical protein [Syntrophomonas palmitatica]|uniref:hypothetical protein n=1 Tax=Syntrophomonas palmitatica TaxID=402877 RepID=UPI0006D0020D|nr:hypothetical protein [Syntrophomonas palmitatica]
MTSREREQLEIFLTESFTNGNMVRELRLSAEEKTFLLDRFPKASLKRMDCAVLADGKEWYEVQL